ncbi:hypothetical protein Nepgr_018008 [Nepenthes gracilis]|uniref:Uncharacterized protein n=1 Tax=Nepenthes gracilis TaxID=150966 RepID=A0AAD3XSP7_NEPGR|nr:hypothetical protein Nepgr_018008 [Nepenthes gracilis]
MLMENLVDMMLYAASVRFLMLILVGPGLVLKLCCVGAATVWGGCSDYELIWFPAGVWGSYSWVGGCAAGAGLLACFNCPYEAVTSCCSGCSCCLTLQLACSVLIHIVDADGWALDILLLPFCAAELLPFGESTVTLMQIALVLWSLGAKLADVIFADAIVKFPCCGLVADSLGFYAAFHFS